MSIVAPRPYARLLALAATLLGCAGCLILSCAASAATSWTLTPQAIAGSPFAVAKPTDVAFDANGELAVAPSEEGGLDLFTITDGVESTPTVLQGTENDWFSSAEFSPNGDYLAATLNIAHTPNYELEIFAVSGTALTLVASDTQDLSGKGYIPTENPTLTWIADSESPSQVHVALIASVDETSKSAVLILPFDQTTGSVGPLVADATGDTISTIAASPDGALLAVGDFTKDEVDVYKTTSLEQGTWGPSTTIADPTSFLPTDVSFSPMTGTNGWLAVASSDYGSDSYIKTYPVVGDVASSTAGDSCSNITTPSCLPETYDAKAPWVTAVGFTPDGNYLVALDSDLHAEGGALDTFGFDPTNGTLSSGASVAIAAEPQNDGNFLQGLAFYPGIDGAYGGSELGFADRYDSGPAGAYFFYEDRPPTLTLTCDSPAPPTPTDQDPTCTVTAKPQTPGATISSVALSVNGKTTVTLDNSAPGVSTSNWQWPLADLVQGANTLTATATDSNDQTSDPASVQLVYKLETPTPVTVSPEKTVPAPSPSPRAEGTIIVGKLTAGDGRWFTLTPKGTSAGAGTLITGYTWTEDGKTLGHGRTLKFDARKANHVYTIVLTVTASDGKTSSVSFHVEAVRHTQTAAPRFAYNSPLLSTADRATITAVAHKLARYLHERDAAVSASVHGYASASEMPFGAQFPANELLLSRERAQAVTALLRRKLGKDHVRITTAWFGGSDPVASNLTLAGQAQNRRVNIAVTTTYVVASVKKHG